LKTQKLKLQVKWGVLKKNHEVGILWYIPTIKAERLKSGIFEKTARNKAKYSVS
jgi:hypothetical protein